MEIVEVGERKRVTFYSLQKEDKEKTETALFLERYEHDAKYSEEFGALANIILEIGNRGAFARYFRHEREAHALPPKFLYSNRLRLYCIRITDNIVILGGGCAKETRTAQESADCKGPFTFMNQVSRAITRSIREGDLWISGDRLGGDLTIEI